MLNVDLQIKLFPNRSQPFLDPFPSIFVYFYKVLAQPSAEQQNEGLRSGQSFNDRITPNRGTITIKWILNVQ